MIQKLLKILILLGRLLLIYLRELILSSLRIAWDAILHGDRSQSGIVEMEIKPLPDTALLLYCMFISMTPGSLPVHVSPDSRKLHIHAMYLDDPEAFKAELKRQFETPIRQLFS